MCKEVVTHDSLVRVTHIRLAHRQGSDSTKDIHSNVLLNV